MDFEQFKNKASDIAFKLRRKPSIWIYTFITVVTMLYASVYIFQTYFNDEHSSISAEDKERDIVLTDNVIQMVENEYNPETEFYIGKFVIKDLNQRQPVIPEDNLDINVIMESNTSEELNISVENVTSNFFIVTIENLPNDFLGLRYDFTMDGSSANDMDAENFESELYTNITQEEINESLQKESIEYYEHESYEYEMAAVNEEIETFQNRINNYNEQIEILEQRIEDNEDGMDRLTSVEKEDMQSTIDSNRSQISTYYDNISKTEEAIAEREEKIEILNNLMNDM